MEMIQAFSQEAASLANKVRICANYQESFSDTQSHMHPLNVEEITQMVAAEISDIDYELTLRKILWEAQDEWRALFQEWRASTLRDIDIESVQRNVSKWMSLILVLEKGKRVLPVFAHLELHTTCPLGPQDHPLSPSSHELTLHGWRDSPGHG